MALYDMDDYQDVAEHLKWVDSPGEPSHLVAEADITTTPTNTADSIGYLAISEATTELANDAPATPVSEPITSRYTSSTEVPPKRRKKSITGTGDSNDATAHYLNKIGEVELLTADEEHELAQVIEDGVAAREALNAGVSDSEFATYSRAVSRAADAKDRFIRSNLRLVVSIAKRYPLPTGMDLLDLVQEGNLGLEHAVDKYDWRRGFKFSTYATYWIRQSIGRALNMKSNLIRLPDDKMVSLRAAVRQTNGDADAMDTDNARLHYLTTPLSLNQRVSHDGDAELGDMIADQEQSSPEEALFKTLDNELVEKLLARLNKRARYAVVERYGIDSGTGRSFYSIGEELGITAEATRRLVSRGITDMQNSFAAQESLDI